MFANLTTDNSFVADDASYNTCSYFDRNDFCNLNVSTPDNFSIFDMNARSLCRHFYDIHDFVLSLNHSFSIYGFSETWFKEAPPQYVQMDNYQLIHSSRSDKTGGGAAMFVRNSLNFHVREDLMSSCEDFECVFIEIERVHAVNLIVGNVYRPPGASPDNFNRSFDSCLNTVTNENKLCYIMGDSNLNLLNCSNHRPTDDFVNTFYAYGFRPLFDKPTRITPHSATLIDNILTNNDQDMSAGILYSDITDHLPLFQVTPFCLDNSASARNTYVTRDINATTIRSFTADIVNLDWGEVYAADQADSAYNAFLSTFNSLYNLHFPFSVKSRGH